MVFTILSDNFVTDAGPVNVSQGTERGAQRDMVPQMARSESEEALHLHKQSEPYTGSSSSFD